MLIVFRNQEVVGSIPTAGFTNSPAFSIFLEFRAGRNGGVAENVDTYGECSGGRAMKGCVKMFLAFVYSALLAGIPSVSMAGGVPSPPSGLSPVTVVGTRFYSNNKPYFPSANFLSSSAGFTHLYLGRSKARKQSMRDATKAAGHNAMFVYTINENDYGGPRFTPYASGMIGGAFDEKKIGNWRNDLTALLNDGIRPILWLIPDDAPAIRSAGSVELKRYIQKMVRSFGDLPVMWVLALEADEYFTQAITNDLGSYLGSLTAQPVGLHQLDGKADWMTASWVDFAAYQYGFGRTWDQIYNDTISHRSIN